MLFLTLSYSSGLSGSAAGSLLGLTGPLGSGRETTMGATAVIQVK